MRPAGYAGKLGYASAGAGADFIVVNMVAEAVSGSKTPKEAVERALRFAYVGRKQKKRDFRTLWITRINAASRLCGMTYSTLIDGLNKAKITLNRKQLSEIAIADAVAFGALIKQANIKLE